jgi:hypothetical protein
MNQVLDSPDHKFKDSSKVRDFDTTEHGEVSSYRSLLPQSHLLRQTSVVMPITIGAGMLTNTQDDSEDEDEDEDKNEYDLPELEAQENIEAILSTFYDGGALYKRSSSTNWPLYMSIVNGERNC